MEIKKAKNRVQFLKKWPLLQVAQFQVYFMVVTSIIPAFMQFYIGAWADIFGRKRLMYIYLMATVVGSLISTLNSAFIMWPKEYIILAQIPTSLVGGFPVWILSQFSFIAEWSSHDTNTKRTKFDGQTYVKNKIDTPWSADLFHCWMKFIRYELEG